MSHLSLTFVRWALAQAVENCVVDFAGQCIGCQMIFDFQFILML